MHVFGNLKRYAQWLRKTGRMPAGGLDALIEENQCNLQSPDVRVRIKQYEWADEYLNEELVRRGIRDNSRKQARFAVAALYEANFSPLAGELRVALHDQPKTKKGILAEEVRRVLLALPFDKRLPVLLQFQTGLNISLVLALRWGDLDLSKAPMRIDFAGRKTNRRPFFTLAGHDSVEGLRVWRKMQQEFLGREQVDSDFVFATGRWALPLPSYLNSLMTAAARRLAEEGLVKSPYANFQTHSLRRCFKSTTAHLNLDSNMVEFMMGHSLSGNMSALYDCRVDFEVSREEAVQPAAPLITSDIRSVLKALLVSDRTPLNQATGRCSQGHSLRYRQPM